MSNFIQYLKKNGYEVIEKKLTGGIENDVRLVTAYKDDKVFYYVLKKYKSEKKVKNMLRGYDLISSIVKTPTIIYHKGTEIAYDYIEGKNLKDMISENDPMSKEAIKLLAQELEKLHKSKKYKPKYKKNDSPDEKKIIKDTLIALNKNKITRETTEKIISLIKNYIPKNKVITHGDAHLGNFLYHNGEVYFLDPDKIRISDYNADLGKILYSLESLKEEGKITASDFRELRDLFLEEYRGEDSFAANMYKLRTALFELKILDKERARKSIEKVANVK